MLRSRASDPLSPAGHERRFLRALSLVLMVSGAALPLGASAPRAGAASPPLRFEPNRGQAGPGVEFLGRAPGYTFMLKRGAGAACVMPRGETISLELAGAASPSGLAEEPLPSVTHYYGGADPAAWRAGIPHYARVRYPRVYPGIDFLWRGRQKELEYELVVGPGADPERIGLRFRGARRIRLDRRGHLVLETASGELRFRRPFAYQREGERRRQVMVRYRVAGDLVTFRIGPWDRSRELLIDPVLSFSSYLGGAGFDAGYGIAADSSGNIYVSGETASADFPLPAGQTGSKRANRDAFVTKLTPDGASVLYTTILASTGNDAGRAIAVDVGGNAYVVGQAGGAYFPVTSGALQSAYGGLEDAFAARLDSSGRLAYATYLGAGGSDVAMGIAVDSQGNAYITGYTGSLNFPTTAGAPQRSHRGGFYDAFVSKLSPAGNVLLYSTLLGGSGNDLGRAIALDASGNTCIAGHTESSDLPVRNALQPSFRGGGDAMVGCLNATGTAWNYLTYLGGTSRDEANGLAVSSAGEVFITGATFSANFPVTPGVFQGVRRGDYDAFIVKLNAAGSALVYSTLLGGSGADAGTAIAVTGSGEAWIAGFTASLDFPVQDAWQASNRGSFDAFVAQVGAGATSLVLSSSLGGSGDDRAWGLALGSLGSVVVAGMTGSTDFPTTSGTVQPGALAPYNAFITGLVGNQPPAALSVSPAAGSGSSQTFSVTVADPNGYGDIGVVYFLVGRTLSGVSACFVAYLPTQHRLLLMNDRGTEWLAPLTSGVEGSASNSQCTLNAAASSVSASGTTLTLGLALLFQPSFAGQKYTYLDAVDHAGLSSGWITGGSWTPDGATNQPPQAVSVSPSSGSGASQTFTVTVADPNGYGDIGVVYFLVGRTLSGVSACFVAYLPAYNRLLLMNDGGTSWLTPLIPGVAGSASNSQCALNAAASSVSASGTTLTLGLALLFQPSFTGQKYTYLDAVDYAGLSSGWIAAGSWTIP